MGALWAGAASLNDDYANAPEVWASGGKRSSDARSRNRLLLLMSTGTCLCGMRWQDDSL